MDTTIWSPDSGHVDSLSTETTTIVDLMTESCRHHARFRRLLAANYFAPRATRVRLVDIARVVDRSNRTIERWSKAAAAAYGPTAITVTLDMITSTWEQYLRSNERCSQAVRRLRSGHSLARIAELVGVSKERIRRLGMTPEELTVQRAADQAAELRRRSRSANRNGR